MAGRDGTQWMTGRKEGWVDNGGAVEEGLGHKRYPGRMGYDGDGTWEGEKRAGLGSVGDERAQ